MSQKSDYNRSPTTAARDIRCMACLIILILAVSGISLAFLLTY